MLFPMLNALYRYISTSRSLCAVPKYGCFPQFFNFVLPAMWFRYCVRGIETVPVAPLSIGIAFVFHIPHALNSYCKVSLLLLLLLLLLLGFLFRVLFLCRVLVICAGVTTVTCADKLQLNRIPPLPYINSLCTSNTKCLEQSGYSSLSCGTPCFEVRRLSACGPRTSRGRRDLVR